MTIFQEAVEIIQQGAAPVSWSASWNSIWPIASSNVEGFKFDPKNKKLYIQFHGPYPQAKGPQYVYDDVPDFIYAILERGAVGPKTSGKNKYHEWIKGVTPSYGAVVNALIKAGGFNYRKVA